MDYLTRYHMFDIKLKHTVIIGPKDYIEGYLAVSNKGCNPPKFAMAVYTGHEKPPRHPSVGPMAVNKKIDLSEDDEIVVADTVKEKVAKYLNKTKQ